MTATQPKLSPFQQTVQSSAEQQSLAATVTEDLGTVYLTITNPARRFSSPVVISSWIGEDSGKVNNAATVSRKTIPLSEVETAVRWLAN